MTVIEQWEAHWRDLSVHLLADPADCASPDTNESAGAKFLDGVRDAMLDLVDSNPEDDWSDALHEIADGAPDVYTSTRWAEFVDLAAYQEEPETGEWPDDLTQAAGWALYQIAYRLAGAMLTDLDERRADNEGDEDDG